MVDISVIIPTYNRAAQLKDCLQALSGQTLPCTQYEVIVVVDGSTDDTADALSKLETPFHLEVIQQENSGQQVARNSGVAAARGRYCLFLDDDIVASPQLLAEHLRAHDGRDDVVGIGPIVLKLRADADWYARCFAQGWLQHYDELIRGERKPRWMDCFGGNLSVPRRAFLEAGAFATDLPRSHDIELGYRLDKRGLSFVFITDAIGQQLEDKDIRGFASEQEKRGMVAVMLARRYLAMKQSLMWAVTSTSARGEFFQRLLFFLRLPPAVLGFVGRILERGGAWEWNWYSFVRKYFFWIGVQKAIAGRSAARSFSRGTPILMYHAFSNDEPASRFVLPIKRFSRQMAWLKFLGYRVIGLKEFVTHCRTFTFPPRRSVVITIDDGFADLILACPILRRHRFPATVFLVSKRVGGINDWARAPELKNRRLLTWTDIGAMSRDGLTFAAHTQTHRPLLKITPEQAREEIGGSKAELEERLHTPVDVFAYPYGQYNATMQAIAEDSGFLGSCGIESGLNSPASPLHALRRLEVYGTDRLFHVAIGLFLGRIPGVFRRR